MRRLLVLISACALLPTAPLLPTATVAAPGLAEIVPVTQGSDYTITADIAAQIEQGLAATSRRPEALAGAFYDADAKRVTLAQVYGSSLDLSELDVPFEIWEVPHSFNYLREILDRAVRNRHSFGTTVNGAHIDFAENRVVLWLEDVGLAQQVDVGRTFGEAVAIAHVAKGGSDMDGPERWRDRFPYWGGAGVNDFGFAPYGEPPRAPGCSTAFSMARPDRSKYFVVTAGHCTLGEVGAVVDASSLAYEWSWTNLIGSSTGYANSLCPTTFNSCNQAPGDKKYGDVAVYRVSRSEGQLYNGGPRSTTSVLVKSSQTGLPAIGTSLCTSGAATGAACGYQVVLNYAAVWTTNTSPAHLRSPVVIATNATNCVGSGDSGGPVYLITTGGVRASGVISGAGYYSPQCGLAYTSISFAQELFAAEVLTS